MPRVSQIVDWVRDEVASLHIDEHVAAIRVRMTPSPAGSGTVARTDVLGERAADLLALELEQTCDGWEPPSGVKVRIDLLDGEGRGVPPSRSRTFRRGGGFSHPEPAAQPSSRPPYTPPAPAPGRRDFDAEPSALELDPQIRQALAVGAAMSPGGDGALDVRPVMGLLMLGHKTQQQDRAQLITSFQEERRELVAFHREQVHGLRQTIKDRDAQIKILSAELTTSHRELRKTITGRDQSRDQLVKDLLARTGEAHEAVARLELANDLEALRLDLAQANAGTAPSKVDEFAKLAAAASTVFGSLPAADAGGAPAEPPEGASGQPDPAADQAGASAAAGGGARDAQAEQSQQLGAYLLAVIGGTLPPSLFASQVVPRLDEAQRANLEALCKALLGELEAAA